MVRFALFGAGRIGALHAANLARSPRCELTCVYDVVEDAASDLAQRHGAFSVPIVADALSANVDAVIIASPTDTHVDLILRSLKVGKAVFCEKPIDLDIWRVEECRERIRDSDVPVQIGFNRRYDPTHRAVAEAVRNGEVGQLEQLIIISRDPAPPPIEYIATSGGLFRDMMIHDFDLARFILGEEPVEVSAMAEVRVDPAIGAAGDVDTAVVTLRCESGALAQITNSRRAIYGYDQRVEAFGSLGMVQSGNRRETEIERSTASATAVRDPLLPFFVERYSQSYVAEIEDFAEAVETGRSPSVTFEDGRRALLLANAALDAHESGTTVAVPQ